MRLSALEQIPLFAGRSPRHAIEDTVRLVRGLEDIGYHRFWLAEHHNTGAFVSSAPDLLMMHMLDATDRIRVGSGGVMAMHYGSLQIAERFATLATLFPGRIDLGLGRAPGGDMLAARALNQGRFIAPEAIDALIDETVALLRDEIPTGHRYAALEVRPAPETLPELWLLGSSGQSAAWAGTHDLGYAYAQFFTGHQQAGVMSHYRSHLPEGASSDRTLSALCVSAAPTREEAREQALAAADFRLALRQGRAESFRTPAALSPERRAEVEAHLERDTAIVVGTYDEVAEELRAFAESHRTDELMLISYIDDVEVKLAQYRELAARLAS